MALTTRFRSIGVGILGGSLLLLSACGGAGVMPPPAGASSGASLAATTFLCESLKPAFAEALGLEVAMTETTFNDIAGGMQRQGCLLTAKGTGAEIQDFIGVSQQLSTVLSGQGWHQGQPLADGPTGTVIGFNGEGQLAQLTVEWKPVPAANCPQAKPISDCTLLPEQKLYTIKLEAAAIDAFGSSRSAADDALQQAVHTYVMENTEIRTFTLVVEGVEGDVARVQVAPAAGAADAVVAYAYHNAQGWSVLAVGSSFEPVFYEQHAIPASLRLGHS